MEIDDIDRKKNSIFKNRPLITALLFFASGIVCSTSFTMSYIYSFILFIIVSIFAMYLYFRGSRKSAGLAVCIMLFLLGWFRADLAGGPFPPNHIENLARINSRALVYGKIVEEPDIRENCTYLVIEADSVNIRNRTVPTFGRVRAKITDGGARYDHSDIVAINGFLYKPFGSRNPGGFDYARYLQTRDIFAAMSVTGPHNVSIIKEGSSFLSSVVKPVRNYMIQVARENLTPVSAAILSGFILGERRDIPEEYQTMFRDTGTLHLMAVSGSNVGLVLTVIAIPLTLIGFRRKQKVFVLLITVIFFAILTRLESSVIRASIMASVGLLAYGWLRKPDYINLLGFAGLLMLFWRPLQIFDVGLQLSFAATFGIVYVVPDIYRRIKPITRKNRKWIRWIVIPLATTFAAQAAVLPLMVLYFNRFPVVGIISNLPIGILASLASALGIVLYMAGLMGGWPEYMIGHIVQFVLDGVRILLGFFNHLPMAVIQLPSFDWPSIFLYWISLYVIYELIFKRRFSAIGTVAALSCLNFIVWSQVFEVRPSWELRFIDVGPNRAWIFTDANGESLGCCDINREDGYVENTVISHILNYNAGRLDWLISSTPDSPVIESIKESFQPEIIEHGKPADAGGDEISGSGKNRSGFLDRIKFIWGQSDNTERGSLFLPFLQVDTGRYYLLMAGRSGAQIMKDNRFDKKIALLELPWSEYARTDCMRTISGLDPDFLVFSPGRNSTSAPGSKSELTHSSERLFATSICGGFRLAEIEGELRVETMEAVEIEE